MPLAAPDGQRLTTLAGMTARGEIRCVIERCYPLAEAAEPPSRHLEVDHARGKVVITI